MEFIRARSQAEIGDRQSEIINACDTLYSQYGYDGVTFQAISQLTSFSRPTIYNYYKTKDEILLALLKRELIHWREEFLEATQGVAHMTREQFSACLTQCLVRHGKMFRLLAILFSTLEANSRLEHLADFYQSVSDVFEAIFHSTGRYFPDIAPETRLSLQHACVAYVLGLHSMTSLSEKQKAAVRLAGVSGVPPAFEPLCYQGILALLSHFQPERSDPLEPS